MRERNLCVGQGLLRGWQGYTCVGCCCDRGSRKGTWISAACNRNHGMCTRQLLEWTQQVMEHMYAATNMRMRIWSRPSNWTVHAHMVQAQQLNGACTYTRTHLHTHAPAHAHTRTGTCTAPITTWWRVRCWRLASLTVGSRMRTTQRLRSSMTTWATQTPTSGRVHHLIYDYVSHNTDPNIRWGISHLRLRKPHRPQPQWFFRPPVIPPQRHTCRRARTCTHKHAHTCTHACTCTHTHVTHMSHTRARTHIYTCARTHVHTHAHMSHAHAHM